MPIDSANWESFYQGAFAEHHISGLFYFYGFEAQKVSPDVGIDLIVTNLARVRFTGDAPLHAEVQVKSMLLDGTGAQVSISAQELEELCTGAGPALPQLLHAATGGHLCGVPDCVLKRPIAVVASASHSQRRTARR